MWMYSILVALFTIFSFIKVTQSESPKNIDVVEENETVLSEKYKDKTEIYQKKAHITANQKSESLKVSNPEVDKPKSGKNLQAELSSTNVEEYNDREELIDKLLNVDPDNVEAKIEMATIYLGRDNDYNSAMMMLEDVLSSGNLESRIVGEYSYAAISSGRQQEALDFLIAKIEDSRIEDKDQLLENINLLKHSLESDKK